MAREPRHHEDRGDRESVGHWLRQWPKGHNLALAGLIVFGILGLIAAGITWALWDNPGSKEEVGATAVAGERPGQQEVVLTDGGFEPPDMTLSMGESLAIRNDTDDVCQLQLNGMGLYALDPGDSTPWAPAEPGEYTLNCSGGPEGELAVTVN